MWLGRSLLEDSLQGDIFFNDISGKERHLTAYGEADFYIFSLYAFQKQSKMCLQSPCNAEMSHSLLSVVSKIT